MTLTYDDISIRYDSPLWLYDGGRRITGVADLPEILRGSHTPAIRVTFVDDEHEVPAKLIGGNVNGDRKREITLQATITLANPDGLYTPTDPSSIVWPGKTVRVERGALDEDGLPVYATLITGLLTRPQVTYGEKTVSFSLWSRLRQLDRAFPEAVTFGEFTPLDEIVYGVCVLAGLSTDTALYDLDHNGMAIPVPRTFTTSDNMLHSLIEFCADYGLDGPYDTGPGIIALRPFTVPTDDDVVWTFDSGEASVRTDLSWALEERSRIVYNRQDVWGVAPDRYPVFGSARDLNPLSPTYNPVDGSGPLGDLPAPPHRSADIHTEATAYAVAFQMLAEHTLADLPIRAEAVPIPTLSPRDVVRFSADTLDVTARIDSLNIPLGPGAMGITAHGVRSLIAP